MFWFPTSKETWLDSVIENYHKKINFYVPFEVQDLKTKKIARENSLAKRKYEEEMFFNKINDSDFLVIFDEKGRLPKSSEDFSKELVRSLESSKQRVIFLIGGAYGIGEAIKQRANLKLSLSHLTMAHPVAMTMALEQIFRAFTIWKNHPYHNT